MAKEIIKKEEVNEVNLYQDFGAEGVADDIESTDLIIPSILLQQSLSKFVSDSVARAGDLCDSLTGEVLGGKDTPVKVIIFSSRKTWEIFDTSSGKAVWQSSEPCTPQNANLPWIDGTTKREVNYRFACILADNSGKALNSFPYIVAMKTYSVPTAKAICSFFARLASCNRPSFSRVIELTSKPKENDKGKFLIFNWKAGRDTTLEECQAAHKWRNTLKSATNIREHSPESNDRAEEDVF